MAEEDILHYRMIEARFEDSPYSCFRHALPKSRLAHSSCTAYAPSLAHTAPVCHGSFHLRHYIRIIFPEKIVQPFSQPLIIADTQKESG